MLALEISRIEAPTHDSREIVMTQRPLRLFVPAVLAIAALALSNGTSEAQGGPTLPTGGSSLVRVWTSDDGDSHPAPEVAPWRGASLGSFVHLAWRKFHATQGFTAPRPLVTAAGHEPRALWRTPRH